MAAASPRGRVLADIRERCARECTDGIEGKVAPQLQPDLGTNVLEDGCLESGAREALRHPLHSLTARAIELAYGKALALDVPDDTRGQQLRGRVDDAANHTRRRNQLANAPFRINAAHDAAGEIPAVAVEVPIGNAVLHGDHHRAGIAQAWHVGRDGGQLMRLHRQDHQLLHAGGRIVIGGRDLARDMPRAVAHDQGDPHTSQRREIRAAHHAGDAFAGERESRRHVSTDRAAADNRDFHGLAPASASLQDADAGRAHAARSRMQRSLASSTRLRRKAFS
jgi:hypothetical protein